MRCLKCKGELEISEHGLKCVNCGAEFLQLNGELRLLTEAEDNGTSNRDIPILTVVDRCSECNGKMVGGEIITEGSENYRVYRCECGAKAWEILVDKKKYTEYCEEIARRLLVNNDYPL